jgi:hypothetical protein
MEIKMISLKKIKNAMFGLPVIFVMLTSCTTTVDYKKEVIGFWQFQSTTITKDGRELTVPVQNYYCEITADKFIDFTKIEGVLDTSLVSGYEITEDSLIIISPYDQSRTSTAYELDLTSDPNTLTLEAVGAEGAVLSNKFVRSAK